MSSKTILITGASQGIGKAIALKMSEDRSLQIENFALVSRRSAVLEKVSKEITTILPKANVKIYGCDVAHEEQINQMVDSVIEDFGHVDFVINNAGYVDPRSIEETTYENLDLTMKVNLYAPFLIVRKLLLKRVYPERILNVSSTAGLTPRAGWIAYAASKSALISMTQTMADELAPYGVKVVAIAPGRCATDLRRTLAPDEDPSTIMQPEDVATVVGHLLGPSGNFIDKQCLIVKQ